MNLLLDTHALLWFASGHRRLSPTASEEIASEGNTKWVSMASLWEMAIKIGVGQLRLESPLEEFVTTELGPRGLKVLPLRLAHLTGVISLPHHHRDPFDRLLAAQCLSEGLSLVSIDAVFDKYGVQRVW